MLLSPDYFSSVKFNSAHSSAGKTSEVCLIDSTWSWNIGMRALLRNLKSQTFQIASSLIVLKTILSKRDHCGRLLLPSKSMIHLYQRGTNFEAKITMAKMSPGLVNIFKSLETLLVAIRVTS